MSKSDVIWRNMGKCRNIEEKVEKNSDICKKVFQKIFG